MSVGGWAPSTRTRSLRAVLQRSRCAVGRQHHGSGSSVAVYLCFFSHHGLAVGFSGLGVIKCILLGLVLCIVAHAPCWTPVPGPQLTSGSAYAFPSHICPVGISAWHPEPLGLPGDALRCCPFWLRPCFLVQCDQKKTRNAVHLFIWELRFGAMPSNSVKCPKSVDFQ